MAMMASKVGDHDCLFFHGKVKEAAWRTLCHQSQEKDDKGMHIVCQWEFKCGSRGSHSGVFWVTLAARAVV